MTIKSKLLITGIILSGGLSITSLGIFSLTNNSLLVLNNASSTTLTKAPSTLKELKEADPNEVAKLPTYDSCKYNIVTKAKHQGSLRTCWSFALANASEVSILRSELSPSYTKDTFDIDQNNIAYITSNRTENADKLGLTLYDKFSENWNIGKSIYYAAQMIMRNGGPVSVETPNASGPSSTDQLFNKKPVAFLKDIVPVDPENINDIKLAISKYGAVSTAYYMGGQSSSDVYWNSNGRNYGDHAITLVGWDDTISRDKFTFNTPTNGGAWIAKNSRGPTSGRGDGCFYLSYESKLSDIVALNYGPTENYQNSYYWNGYRPTFSGFDKKKAAAIFPVKKATNDTKEFIKAIGFGLSKGKNIDVKIDVYKNVHANELNPLDDSNDPTSGTLVSTVSKSFTNHGFYTVDLPKPIEIQNGEYFSVVVEITNPNSTESLLTFNKEKNSYNDMTFYQDDNGKWRNSNINDNHAVAEIRAITTTEKISGATSENNLSYANLSLDQNQYTIDRIYRYNDLVKPKVIVKYRDESTPLVENKDYTVSYGPERFLDSFQNNSDNNLVGYGQITVKGKGNYSGQQTIAYPIKIGLVPDAYMFDIKTDIYGVMSVIMSAGLDCNSYKDIQLPTNWVWVQPDKEILPGENTGNYIQYNGDSTYYRKSMLPVILTKTDLVPSDKTNINLVNASLDSTTEITYNGQAKTPNIILSCNGSQLIEGTDYTISYRNNINAGTGEIIIRGQGNYGGWKVVNFQIKKAPNSINVQFDQTTDTYNVTTTNGKVYYKYFSNEQCTQQLNQQPTTQGTYWVKAYVDETSNYLPAESQPFKYVISSTSIPILPDVEVDGNKPSDDIISTKPESPTSSNSSTNENNNQNLVIILATVIPSIVVISSLGIGLYLNKKRKNKKNS
ncbi:lectin like domain-containing protein [Mycoplasmoides alvi]|uniref:lectin like domain-containing protein n=1 Tax=Mycoplasmoides alvi TaxID=78580 RepID=UPI00051B71B6|nr:lectin like domain-containing protein [Mycoplasmoides alvi]